MADEIETLYVAIKANTDQLLAGARKGVAETKKELGKLDGVTTGTKKEVDKIGLALNSLGQKGKAAFQALKTAALGAIGAIAGLSAGIVAAFQAAEEGLRQVRTRRSFRALAADAGQSSTEILAAMKRASKGTIAEFQLIGAGAEALNFKIAKTPEQFERLVAAAIKLGRIRGVSSQEALSRLISGIGRNEVELLDELGLNLVMINQELEILAQRDFGKSAKGLSAVQRGSIFAEAALNAAEKAAGRLGEEVGDIGTGLEQAQADIANFQADVNEGFTLLLGRTATIAGAMKDSFFGPNGVFPLFAEGGNVVAEVFAGVLAAFLATAGTMAQQVNNIRKTLRGEMSIGELETRLSGPGLVAQFAKNFQDAFKKIETDFAEILAPETLPEPAGGGAPTPPAADTGTQEKIKEKYTEFYADLLDLADENETRLEETASDHNDRILEIESDYTEKRLELGAKLADELGKLEQETAAEREEIISQARQELADLSAETDRELAKEQQNFDTEEFRRTEDHLRSMRDLRSRYLLDLEDAVKNRDARAIVDLQRRFREEQSKEEENFQTQEQRQQEDQDTRLAEIRENERLRAEEIVRAREEDLTGLMENERRKRDEIQLNFQEQMAELDTNRAEQLARENANYQEQVAALTQAMEDRLRTIARELAQEKEIDEAAAKEMLSRLSEQFLGEEGALAIIQDYVTRRKALLEAADDIMPSTPTSTQTSSPGGRTRRTSGMRSFATGGSMIASSPTLVQFGEIPEMATFTPLSQLGSNSLMTTKRLEVDINMSGSAPPGIRAPERDQIAAVLVAALRDAGMS